MYEFLLFLHVLAAFALVAGIVCVTPYALTRAEGPVIDRLAKTGGILAAAGSLATLILGLLLVWEAGYGLFELWIVLAIVLWLVGTGTGERSGKVERSKAARLHVPAATAAFVILILMIWKPGA